MAIVFISSNFSVMPKKKFRFTIKYYDKDNCLFHQEFVYSYTYLGAFSQFMEKIQLHLEIGFSYIRRIDFVSGSHVLFMFCDVRSLLDQFNKSIKVQSYD